MEPSNNGEEFGAGHNVHVSIFNRLPLYLYMTIQVFPYNEKEEKELLAFLESHHYNYKSGDSEVDLDFLKEYNKEINDAEAEIDAGNYVSHDEVKKFFANKRKARQ